MGVKPVSFVYQEFKDETTFTKWIELERSMGYDAKGCISPNQVKLVNAMFVDKEAEIKRAKVIVKLFEMHKDEGITGFVDEEYGFIDEPIYKGALALFGLIFSFLLVLGGAYFCVPLKCYLRVFIATMGMNKLLYKRNIYI
ncbi:MAG: hypothetical protein Q9M40_09990 [Sulfurimonas sp.]|nr:hypothetical protein [Sulfurimonas sp.]